MELKGSKRSAFVLKPETSLPVPLDLSGDIIQNRSAKSFEGMNGFIEFNVHLQRSPSRSATESELRALTETGCSLVFWRKIFTFMRLPIPTRLPLHCDSTGAIQNGRHVVASRRLRHVALDVFTIREFIMDGLIKLIKIPTDWNPSDIGTKILGKLKFTRFTDFITFHFR